ncbi:MAG: APC family permease [Planctomycetaceae bacterium]
MSAPNNPPADPPRTLGVVSGSLLIMANMIGVGVFTTTGSMLAALQSGPAILLAWGIGGLAAVCGALSYAELGAAIPRNGGEFQLLSRIYHPVLGFLAGWVALVVGFAAPLAFYAHVFGDYFSQLFPVHPLLAGIGLILFFAVTHSLSVGQGVWVHSLATLLKLLLIILFVGCGFLRGDPARLFSGEGPPLAEAVWQSAFAVQLVYVSFSYSGWNAAAYLLGEFHNPQRDVPRVVLWGTGVVTLLYVALNAAFLVAAPSDQLAGREDVARVAATHLLGPNGGKFVALLIALGLVSTASANLLTGPRVYEAMGRRHPRLAWLSLRRAGGGPFMAIVLQSVLALVMLVSASFETLMSYIGVTLSLSAATTVLGLIVLRHREPNLLRPYRVWGYPFTPLVFLVLEGWMIGHALWKLPVAAAWTLGTLIGGVVLYGWAGQEAVPSTHESDTLS